MVCLTLMYATELTLIVDLNERITDFLLIKATIYSRDQWLRAYPVATE